MNETVRCRLFTLFAQKMKALPDWGVRILFFTRAVARVAAYKISIASP